MSITFSFLSSSIPTLKKTHKIFPYSTFSHNQILHFPSPVVRIKLELKHKCSEIFTSNCGFQSRRKNGFIAKAESSGIDNGNSVDKAGNEVHGESTMPDIFRYLTKEAPAALAAVGEPWVRLVVMVSYTALAILQHSKTHLNKSEGETTGAVRKVPVPLICAALAIGVRLAAKWAGYQHLTWMII